MSDFGALLLAALFSLLIAISMLLVSYPLLTISLIIFVSIALLISLRNMPNRLRAIALYGLSISLLWLPVPIVHFSRILNSVGYDTAYLYPTEKTQALARELGATENVVGSINLTIIGEMPETSQIARFREWYTGVHVALVKVTENENLLGYLIMKNSDIRTIQSINDDILNPESFQHIIRNATFLEIQSAVKLISEN